MVTDEKYRPLGKIVPGKSATTEPIEERKAPLQPIRIFSAGDSTKITGTTNLPLVVSLHGSQARGGAVSNFGDVYVFFGSPEMGWRDGLPGIFCVYEQAGKTLYLFMRDAIEDPDGDGAVETCWFGYYCIPFGATHSEPRAYPFTERRLEWAIKWAIARYKVDPMRVYSVGQSMGGMGSTQFSWRHPEIFAAVYPRLGRVRQSWLPSVAPNLPRSLHRGKWNKPALMCEGQTDYFLDRMDSVKYAQQHHEDLPFYGFCAGRQDWVETWAGYIEMVRALTVSHHGFAFAWNNGGHDSEGAKAKMTVDVTPRWCQRFEPKPG
ncbi:MAG: hypothetical protein ACUVWX_08515, partial [Kiritimatiellia bacterium]